MKKTLKVLTIIVGILAMIAVVTEFINLGVSLIISFINIGQKGSIASSLESIGITTIFEIVLSLVSLPFIIIELKNGIQLLKLAKKNNIPDSMKPTVGLINSVLSIYVYGIIRKIILFFEIAIIEKQIVDSNLIILLVIGIFIMLFGRMATSKLKRNNFLPMTIIGIIYIILGFVYFPISGFFNEIGVLNIISNIITVTIMTVVFVYCVICLPYYFKNREEIDKQLEDEKDVEILKELKNNRQKVKVYQERKAKGSVAVFVLLLIALGLNVVYLLSIAIPLIQSGITIDFSSFSISSFTTIIKPFMLLGVLLLIPYNIVALYGLLTKNSTYYLVFIILITNVSFIFMSIFIQLFDGIEASIASAESIASLFSLPVVFFTCLIPSCVMGAIAKKNFAHANDEIKNGETVKSTSHYIKLAAIFYAIFNFILSSAYILISLLMGSEILLGACIYPIQALITMIAFILYPKHNLEESYIEIRKKHVESIPEKEKIEAEPIQTNNI